MIYPRFVISQKIVNYSMEKAACIIMSINNIYVYTKLILSFLRLHNSRVRNFVADRIPVCTHWLDNYPHSLNISANKY